MKRYRLLKDLPTFRAGDKFELVETGHLMQLDDGGLETGVVAYSARTLARFPNILEDWFEEIEEPEYWYSIYQNGVVMERRVEDDTHIDDCKEIGNYFDTREEAEKAVEKLRAWKRLRDLGFRFERWKCQNRKMSVGFDFTGDAWATEVEPDLNLLFGGEEFVGQMGDE